MATFSQRLVGAAKLDVHTYEEVESDLHALPQAMGAVVLSAVCAGIGTGGAGGPSSLFIDTGVALLGWFIWAWLTYLIGAKFLGTKETHADLGQLLRTTGFSASPGILRLLAVAQPIAPVVLVVAHLWMLAAFVVAVRQALDYTSTWRALAVCAIGWVGYIALLYFLTTPVPLEVSHLRLP